VTGVRFRYHPGGCEPDLEAREFRGHARVSEVVLDTNVFVSGIFFTGPPFRILTAWRHGEVTPVLSLEILAEYRRVDVELAEKHQALDLAPFLTLAAIHGELVDGPPARW